MAAEALRLNMVMEVKASAGELTLGPLLLQYLEHTADRRTTTSNDGVRQIIFATLIPMAGDWKLTEITPARIELLYSRLRNERHLSPGTIRHYHHVLNPTLKLAVRMGLLTHNPALTVELPPMRRKKLSIPSPREVAELVASATEHDPELGLFLRLCAVTGARRGEIAALRWKDVVWTERSIDILGTLTALRVEAGMSIRG